MQRGKRSTRHSADELGLTAIMLALAAFSLTVAALVFGS